MKAKFVGDPRDPNPAIPNVFAAHGVAFPSGKFVDVPDDKAEKFEGNSHFETQGVKGDASAKRAAKAPAAASDAERGSVGSTTGDPEISTREEKMAHSAEKNRTASDPMGEPG